MLNNDLAGFYERDIRKLIEEINLFANEHDLWRTEGTVKNSCGNIVLHIIGGLNFHIGVTIAHANYTRNREEEFSKKNIPREELIQKLEQLIPVVTGVLNKLTPHQLDEDFPKFFDNPGTSMGYVLVQLLAHLNYHLGQINYLRRIFK